MLKLVVKLDVPFIGIFGQWCYFQTSECFFFLIFKSNILEYNLHIIKGTCSKCTVQQVLTNIHMYVTTTTIKVLNIFITSNRSCIPLQVTSSTFPHLISRQLLISFLSLWLSFTHSGVSYKENHTYALFLA